MLVPRNYRTSIFDDLFSISRDLNRFFDTENNDLSTSYSFPLTNLYEDADNYYLNAELPGLKKEDIKINVTSNSVSIEGTRESEVKEGDNVSYHRKERRFGSFSRTFSLNDKINVDKVSAEYKEGILKLTLPKSEEKKAKPIEIKAE